MAGSQNTFFAMMSRMKYIKRWALMRNSASENISEHSLEVAMIAHALAVIGNTRLGMGYNPEHIAMLGVYHDCTEIITGDMPTPVKYNNELLSMAYKEIEAEAALRIINMLPADMQEYYKCYFGGEKDKEALKLVKAADKLSALVKCIEEEKAGNKEFVCAKASVMAAIEKMKCREAEIFCQEFIGAYGKTLDEL